MRRFTLGTRFNADSPMRGKALLIEPGDDLQALFDEIKALPRSHEPENPGFENVETMCWAILAESNITPGPMLVKAPASNARTLEWRKFTDADKADYRSWVGWTLTTPECLAEIDAQGFIPFDSRDGYACRMLDVIKALRGLLERDSTTQAVRTAMKLGALYGEFRMAEWLTRTKSTNAASKNAQARSDAIRIASETWCREPTARIGDVVRLIGLSGCKQTPKVIRGWLVDASDRGDLSIPPEGRRPGRPPK